MEHGSAGSCSAARALDSGAVQPIKLTVHEESDAALGLGAIPRRRQQQQLPWEGAKPRVLALRDGGLDFTLHAGLAARGVGFPVNSSKFPVDLSVPGRGYQRFEYGGGLL